LDSKLEDSASRIIGEPNKVTSEESRRWKPGAMDCSSSTKGVEDAPIIKIFTFEKVQGEPDRIRLFQKSCKT